MADKFALAIDELIKSGKTPEQLFEEIRVADAAVKKGTEKTGLPDITVSDKDWEAIKAWALTPVSSSLDAPQSWGAAFKHLTDDAVSHEGDRRVEFLRAVLVFWRRSRKHFSHLEA